MSLRADGPSRSQSLDQNALTIGMSIEEGRQRLPDCSSRLNSESGSLSPQAGQKEGHAGIIHGLKLKCLEELTELQTISGLHGGC